ncbi:hypothetical protein A3F66_06695 [candidate division TM6 bacterium RIFCSPHIGHO2_12_FULL_32_22]|nr:MAG: hypothetical protein A3F66_06695 [candidate division TM6 bacterium RIFCSPHIGHO2_12_FULL_32_22]
MKQILKSDHSVAWFTLFQFISRGEKEKALNIYKLLSRSINDHALILQLKGDILVAFNDLEAQDLYLESIKLYIAQNRLSEAISIYEKLILISEKSEYLTKLLNLYIKNENYKKFSELSFKCAELYVTITPELKCALSEFINYLLKKSDKELQKYLSGLDALNNNYYKYALEILEK